jgi:hypothetical protein
MVGSVFGFVPREIMVFYPKNDDPIIIARRLHTLLMLDTVQDGQAKRNTRQKRKHVDHLKVA